MPTLTGKVSALNRVWNTDTLTWDAMVQPSTGGSGGAGSTVVTVSTGSVRVHQSSAADLNVTVANFSTQVSLGDVVASAALPATDRSALPIRLVPQERSSGDVTLGALNDTVAVELTGFASAGGRIDAGTLTGTIAFEGSTNGGVSYSTVAVVGPLGTQVTSLSLSNPNSAGTFEFLPGGQLTHVRLRISAYTSGSAVARVRASTVISAFAIGSLSAGLNSLAAPLYATQVGGRDGAGVMRPAMMLDGTPTSTSYGFVMRLPPPLYDSTNQALRVFEAGSSASTQVTVRQSTAADLQATVTPVAGSTWAVRPVQSSAADLQMTATPVAGSTWATRPIQSSRADLQVTAYNTDNLGNLIESSTRAVGTNSTMRGLSVRSIVPDSTSASGQASSAGDNTLISSAATGIYVYAYCFSALSSAAQLIRFLNGSTNEIWRVRTLGGSTAGYGVSISELSVSPPGYLFRTAAANPLILNVTSSGVNYSVSAWRE